MNKWREVKFKDILLIPIRNGLSKPKAIRGDGVKMVNMGEIFKYNRIYDIKMDRVPTTDKELVNNKLEQGDLLFARQSLVLEGAGKCSIIMQAQEDLVYESHLIRARLNEEIANPLYYYYYFSSYIGNNNIKSIVEQVSAAGIRGSDLIKLKIPLPPLNEQAAIASMLSCFDDKIELNDKINKNLEEAVMTLYKSWFVNFDQFQNGEFVDSELGKIPKAWRVGTIADLGNVVGGSTPSKTREDYYTTDGIAWITPKDLSVNKDKFFSKGALDITDLGLKNSSAKIMPKGTVLFSSRAPIGYITIAQNDITTNQGFKSITPNKTISTEYLYCYLKNNIDIIESRASGSTFKEVSGSVMKKIPALIPSDDVLSQFNAVCRTYFEEQEILEAQNKVLINMRDILLPKLMSCEIRVPLEEID